MKGPARIYALRSVHLPSSLGPGTVGGPAYIVVAEGSEFPVLVSDYPQGGDARAFAEKLRYVATQIEKTAEMAEGAKAGSLDPRGSVGVGGEDEKKSEGLP